MKEIKRDHPTEDLLTEHALNGGLSAIGEHLKNCRECSDFVDQVKLLRNAFQEIEEERVPIRIRERIFKAASTGRKKSGVFLHLIGYNNRFPFLIGILTIFIVLLFYFLFMGFV